MPLFILTACVNRSNERIETLHEGSYVVKARYVDGRRDGKTEVYDSSGKLGGVVNYKDGLKSGTSIHYFSNGIVADSVRYECGKEQGYWRHFFPNGEPRHINYYYYGLEFGPDLWYDKDTILRTFQFLDFERHPIVICSYNEHGNIDSLKKIDLTIMLEEKEKNGVPLFHFFAYLPQIPLAKQSYYIGISDKNKLSRKLCDVKESTFFIDTVLAAPPRGYHFYLGCDLKADDGVFDQTIMVEAIKKEN